MRVDAVLDIEPPVEELVGLEVGVGVGGASLWIVVGFGEEPRRAQDHDRKALVSMRELAEILGGDLGDAVDVLRYGSDVLVDPRRRCAGRRLERAAERARRAREDERADPRAR